MDSRITWEARSGRARVQIHPGWPLLAAEGLKAQSRGQVQPLTEDAALRLLLTPPEESGGSSPEWLGQPQALGGRGFVFGVCGLHRG